MKVDRANSLAVLEFNVGQVKIKATVGLGIVPKGDEAKRVTPEAPCGLQKTIQLMPPRTVTLRR